jgi:TadE-like protein
LVEFALVFPLFLLLMVGIEFGRAYNIYENVIHATREGVRAASADYLTSGNCTPGSYSKLTPTRIRTKIRAQLSAINISVPDSDIIIDNATDLVLVALRPILRQAAGALSTETLLSTMSG